MKMPIQVNHEWNRPYIPTGGAEKVFLLLECKGIAGVQVNRAPINLSLVLDRSGSMSGDPLQFSKKACQFVITQMSAQDTLSLVAFDNEVTTVFPPQAVIHKDAMKQHVEQIQAGGSTNLSGGMLQGIQHVMQNKKDGVVQRVIVLSDGHANEGITDQAKLGAIAREFQSAGIGISTMGVGDGFDEELMETIADNGGGNFYYIQKPDDIPSIFNKELSGLLSVVAQNVQLKLKPSETAIITNIYGYKATDADGEITISLGDVFDQEEKSILLEMAFYPHSPGEHPVLEVEWQFVDVTQGANLCQIKSDVKLHFTNDINLINQPANMKVEKQVQITESAKAIEEAMLLFDTGNLDHAKGMLKQQADKMLQMAIQCNDLELREESEMLYNQLEQLTPTSASRKALHEQKYRQMKRKKK
ncbi:vWA domain-containing protein [Brevibacillus sp. H7]|uniref:vWA domain-containing protein n=1 Tax=Brevibacillus sp. H7 TaxID=3349138 RepID=UPI0037FDAF4C